MMINLLRPRPLWALFALISTVIVLLSLALTHWAGLDPCHLCIFQRLLFMLLAALAFMALLLGAMGGRVIAWLTGGLAALGAGVAAYQVWLQHQPAGTVSCAGAELTLLERFVEWLSLYAPSLFMATGLCEDDGAVILGLSLAAWALLAFLGALLLSVWLARYAYRAR